MQVDGLVTVTAQPHTPALVPVICPPECRSCFLANMYRSSLSVKAFSLSLFCNYRSSLVVPATHLYVDSSNRLASSHVYMCGSPPQGADTVYVHFSWRIEVQKSAHAHMEARACELALHVQDRQIDTGMHMLWPWELWSVSADSFLHAVASPFQCSANNRLVALVPNAWCDQLLACSHAIESGRPHSRLPRVVTKERLPRVDPGLRSS